MLLPGKRNAQRICLQWPPALRGVLGAVDQRGERAGRRPDRQGQARAPSSRSGPECSATSVAPSLQRPSGGPARGGPPGGWAFVVPIEGRSGGHRVEGGSARLRALSVRNTVSALACASHSCLRLPAALHAPEVPTCRPPDQRFDPRLAPNRPSAGQDQFTRLAPEELTALKRTVGRLSTTPHPVSR